MIQTGTLDDAQHSDERRRFVLLFHVLPPHADRPSHWDLMIELGTTLRTWAMPVEISPHQATDSRVAGIALVLPDHRLAYLDYEGPVSGDRGTVRRIASGVWTSMTSRDSLTRRTDWPDDPSPEFMIELDGLSTNGERFAGQLVIARADERQACHWYWRPLACADV